MGFPLAWFGLVCRRGTLRANMQIRRGVPVHQPVLGRYSLALLSSWLVESILPLGALPVNLHKHD